MAAKYSTNQLIPENEGRARINGLDVNFTSGSEVNENYNVGTPVIDAVTDKPVRLAGRPSYDSLTLTTPRTKAATTKIDAWLKTTEAQPNNVSLTITAADIVYTYTNCTVAQSPKSPAFDANADQTVAQFITIIIEIGGDNLLEVTAEERQDQQININRRTFAG